MDLEGSAKDKFETSCGIDKASNNRQERKQALYDWILESNWHCVGPEQCCGALSYLSVVCSEGWEVRVLSLHRALGFVPSWAGQGQGSLLHPCSVCACSQSWLLSLGCLLHLSLVTVSWLQEQMEAVTVRNFGMILFLSRGVLTRHLHSSLFEKIFHQAVHWDFYSVITVCQLNGTSDMAVIDF